MQPFTTIQTWLLLLLTASKLIGADLPPRQEFKISDKNIRITKLAVDPFGDCWFNQIDGIGKITRNGEFTLLNLGFVVNALAIGRDGNIWVACMDPPKIASVSSTGVVLQEFDLAAGTWISNLMCGPDGNLYFQASNSIWTFSTSSGIAMSLTQASSNTSLPIFGPNGTLSFYDPISNTLISLNISAVGLTQSRTHLPTVNPGVATIATGPDGRIWFADQSNRELGKYDPKSDDCSFIKWDSNFLPFTFYAVGEDGNLWGTSSLDSNGYAVFNPNNIPKETPLPSSSECLNFCRGKRSDVWIAELGTLVGSFIIHQELKLPPSTITGLQVHLPSEFSTARYRSLSFATMEGKNREGVRFGELCRRHLMRAFLWNTSTQSFTEFPYRTNWSALKLDQGLLVQSTLDLDIDLTGTPSLAPYDVQIAPGWNFVGVPVIKDGERIYQTHSLAEFNLMDSNGSILVNYARTAAIGTAAYYWNGTSYDPVTTLESGKAYWIKNYTNQTLTLTRVNTLTGGVVFMSDSERSGASGGGTTGSGGGGDAADLPPPIPTLSAEAASNSHPCGTGSTVGIVLALSSFLALRWRRRAA